jgi:DNA-binding PadR family transcriptional regulator
MTTRRSPIALAVLALLYEEPMHPYRMQQLIKQRGKEEVINVRQRASLYQTIERLDRTGLIQVRETQREERRPERTIYAITEQGRATMDRWLREMLSTPTQEFPEFPAALAFLALLTPADALLYLGQRAARLEQELSRLDGELQSAAEMVPRLFLLESEYLRSIVAAELQWVQAIVVELRTGSMTWNEAWLREVALRLEGDGATGVQHAKGDT